MGFGFRVGAPGLTVRISTRGVRTSVGPCAARLSLGSGNVCEAANTAFSDSPTAIYAVGVDGSAMSVVMRQQDLDTMPAQTAGLPPSDRPTLKNLTKRDRTLR